ncbi:MAG: hypothetical protein HRT69_00445 [Flavobacteriaceae bacterium]|nr:hypothetical protein [Flavobacteriaceae bacterium]
MFLKIKYIYIFVLFTNISCSSQEINYKQFTEDFVQENLNKGNKENLDLFHQDDKSLIELIKSPEFINAIKKKIDQFEEKDILLFEKQIKNNSFDLKNCLRKQIKSEVVFLKEMSIEEYKTNYRWNTREYSLNKKTKERNKLHIISKPIFLKDGKYCIIAVGRWGASSVDIYKKENQHWIYNGSFFSFLYN